MAHSVCNQCKHVMLTEDWLAQSVPVCPKCGDKHFTMTFHSTLEFLPHNTFRVKQRDPYHKSRKKLRREHFVGMEANKDGEMMIKERLIDKDANIYYEYVKDPVTGEVTRQVQEKLTDHTSRGTARRS